MMKVLIIIPAYNEGQNIKNVIDDINKNADMCDYIIINDSSKDNTLDVCTEFNFNVISLPVNLGIGGAMQTGYKYAYNNEYDVAIQFDGDGQHNAKYIYKLIEEISNSNCDMIVGSRFIKNEGFQSSIIRRMGINFFKYLLNFIFKYEITDATSGFRAVNRDIIKEFSIYYPKDYPEPETISMILRKGYKIKEIPVKMRKREYGKSSINFIKSIYYMVKVSTAIIIDSKKHI